MILASERVRALVSGIAGHANRKNRAIFVLQAYFDESEQSGKVFVLGGYITTVENWEILSDKWAALLQKHKIPEFKMRLSWRNHDRASEFHSLIQDHVAASISCSIDRSFLDWFVPQMGIPPEREDLRVAFNNPYHWAFKILFCDGLKHKHKVGLQGPIDFIFDERADSKKVLDAWQYFKYTAPPELLAHIGSMPAFKPSNDFMPIQARICTHGV